MHANRHRITKLTIVLKSIPIRFDPKIKYPNTMPAIIANPIFAHDILLSANIFDLTVFLTIIILNFLSI